MGRWVAPGLSIPAEAEKGWRLGEFVDVAVGLVDGELVDAAVFLFAAGGGDGFVEFGAGCFLGELLTQQTTFENEDVSVAEVVAGFGDELGGAGERGLGGVEVGRVFVESRLKPRTRSASVL